MQAAVSDFGSAETRFVFDESRFQQDFFQLFGLPTSYRIDHTQLDQHYHALQVQVHPDKFSHLSEAERRVSMQWATRVNEAYQTLNNPIKRARYLLSLRGVDTQEETNTIMPAGFLMEQMEWHEAIQEAEEARDAGELDKLKLRLQHEVHVLQQQLADQIDIERDYAAATEGVRKLKFLEKLAEEINSAFDAIDN
ncbi:MAG: Fe-S protein assembly co-chaperone HscB [Gallionellaceae bacterium]|nr:Fe-S protein assembly co-chaperone HscB [Gallionellaceae bacterium]